MQIQFDDLGIGGRAAHVHAQIRYAEEQGVDAVDGGDRFGVVHGLAAFQLRDAQGVQVAGAQVFVGGSGAPASGAAGASGAADAARRKADRLYRQLRLFGRVDVGDQYAVGPGVQNALDGGGPQFVHAHQCQQALGGGRIDQLVGGADVDRGVFLVDHHKVIAGVREDLHGLDRGQLDPGPDGAGGMET